MSNLAVVFLTGLTTGGLSCLAVQGGLLASSVAHQAEKDVQQALVARNTSGSAPKKGKKSGNVRQPHLAPAERTQPQRHLTWPILLFLGAKLAAYTIFGLLLGWAGSMLQLTPAMRATLQLAIGVFMVGTALRMFNVHPIFRSFALEPPTFITRYLRRTAKHSSHDVATPIVLGALTVLIPCGVTQAMMALAMGTGDPLLGAAIMFSFTLGTSPVFFTLAYLATRLGEKLESHFVKFAAVAVLVLGLVSIDGGLNLLGSPLSFATMTDSFAAALAAPAPPAANESSADSGPSAAENTLTIEALSRGYAPSVLRARAGQPLKLAVVTNKTFGCSRAFVIPALGIDELLPPTGTTIIDIPAQAAGTLRFTCSMGMYGGRIEFK